MYCPKCGKQQLSNETRFCAKCGLLLETARESLTAGNVPMTVNQTRDTRLSPRAKGILQGIAIIPTSIGAMAVIDIFYEWLGAKMMAPLYTMLTIVVLVALLRIIYAVFIEDGPARSKVVTAPSHGQQHEAASSLNNAVVAAPTGQIVQPQSISEQTTRQLGSNQ